MRYRGCFRGAQPAYLFDADDNLIFSVRHCSAGWMGCELLGEMSSLLRIIWARIQFDAMHACVYAVWKCGAAVGLVVVYLVACGSLSSGVRLFGHKLFTPALPYPLCLMCITSSVLARCSPCLPDAACPLHGRCFSIQLQGAGPIEWFSARMKCFSRSE